MKLQITAMNTLVALAILLLVGCASPERRPRVERADMQSMLSEAGFTRTDADLALQLEAIRALPQGIVFPQVEGGENYYTYADAEGCKCVYVGTETDFFRFEQLVFRRGAERNQCIDDRLSASQEEQWRTLGGLGNLCGR